LFHFIAAVTASTLMAQQIPISDVSNVDENGNGTFASDERLAPADFLFEGFAYSYQAPDPSGGITNSPVLIYDLEALTVDGDVAVAEPGQSTIAKLLRFYTTNDDTLLIYYSQPDGTPAGVGIPHSSNPVTITQTNTPVRWYPSNSTQPGYAASDAYPEGFWGYGYYFQTEKRTEPVHLSGTNMIWQYTSAFSVWPFYVLACTNLSLPLTNWACLSTNMSDQFGGCVLTLPVTAQQPCLFYRVKVPIPEGWY
jgi:hypothetical protein